MAGLARSKPGGRHPSAWLVRAGPGRMRHLRPRGPLAPAARRAWGLGGPWAERPAAGGPAGCCGTCGPRGPTRPTAFPYPAGSVAPDLPLGAWRHPPPRSHRVLRRRRGTPVYLARLKRRFPVLVLGQGMACAGFRRRCRCRGSMAVGIWWPVAYQAQTEYGREGPDGFGLPLLGGLRGPGRPRPTGGPTALPAVARGAHAGPLDRGEAVSLGRFFWPGDTGGPRPRGAWGLHGPRIALPRVAAWALVAGGPAGVPRMPTRADVDHPLRPRFCVGW